MGPGHTANPVPARCRCGLCDRPSRWRESPRGAVLRGEHRKARHVTRPATYVLALPFFAKPTSFCAPRPFQSGRRRNAASRVLLPAGLGMQGEAQLRRRAMRLTSVTYAGCKRERGGTGVPCRHSRVSRSQSGPVTPQACDGDKDHWRLRTRRSSKVSRRV
jgi:hypothetical protein